VLETIIPFAAIGRSMPSLFVNTGLFARVILLILFVMSVISLAVIWDRTRLYLRLRNKGNALRRAMAATSIGSLMDAVPEFMPSIEGSILAEARRYVGARRSHTRDGRIVVTTATSEELERAKLREALDRRALSEISGMERHLIFLATTVGAAPFLGLLGTVWGIMDSFLSMGAQGSASIEVVGPGIAEALVTTIGGLAAAIPALVGYNILVRNVHRKETMIDAFISRVIEYCITTEESFDVEVSSPRIEASGAKVKQT
jgi:biopolymer transport protein TolQ